MGLHGGLPANSRLRYLAAKLSGWEPLTPWIAEVSLR